MAYADDERSALDGEPAELFEFLGPQVAYRYASGTEAVVLDGQSFAPTTISRTSVAAAGTQDTPALVVTLPSSAQVVADYGFSTPPRTLRLRVHRKQEQSGEFRVIWDGQVVALSPKGRLTEARSVSQIADRIEANVPAITFQRLCNHFLYDGRCRVDRAAYDFAAIVTTVNGSTVTLNSVGLAPDQYYRAGEIVRDLDGERRTIVDQVGAVLKLSSPFRTLANGNAVTLYAGCDHKIGTCSDKFNNRANFGGHPSVPSSNPFVVGITLTRGS